MKKELDKRAHPIIEGFNLAAVLRKVILLLVTTHVSVINIVMFIGMMEFIFV